METSGNTILQLDGYPASPFGSGTYQVAYKAQVVLGCTYIKANDQLTYIFKQHKMEHFAEDINDIQMDIIEGNNEKQSCKVFSSIKICLFKTFL